MLKAFLRSMDYSGIAFQKWYYKCAGANDIFLSNLMLDWAPSTSAAFAIRRFGFYEIFTYSWASSFQDLSQWNADGPRLLTLAVRGGSVGIVKRLIDNCA